jgi:hypothetical protein
VFCLRGTLHLPTSQHNVLVMHFILFSDLSVHHTTACYISVQMLTLSYFFWIHNLKSTSFNLKKTDSECVSGVDILCFVFATLLTQVLKYPNLQYYIHVGTYFKFIATIFISVKMIIATTSGKIGNFLFSLLEASKNLYVMLWSK